MHNNYTPILTFPPKWVHINNDCIIYLNERATVRIYIIQRKVVQGLRIQGSRVIKFSDKVSEAGSFSFTLSSLASLASDSH